VRKKSINIFKERGIVIFEDGQAETVFFGTTHPARRPLEAPLPGFDREDPRFRKTRFRGAQSLRLENRPTNAREQDQGRTGHHPKLFLFGKIKRPDVPGDPSRPNQRTSFCGFREAEKGLARQLFNQFSAKLDAEVF